MSAVVTCEGIDSVGYYFGSGGGGASSIAKDKTRKPMHYYGKGVGFIEPPGRWGGKLAERFALAGKDIDPEVMNEIYTKNVSPQGVPLGQAHAQYRSAFEIWSERVRAEVGEERVGQVEAEMAARYPSASPGRLGMVVSNHLRREIEEERLDKIQKSAERAERKAKIGWDMTLNLSKSITVAHAACHWRESQARQKGDERTEEAYRSMREAIEKAIWDAHGEMMRYAERIILSRNGAHGKTGQAETWIEVTEILYGAFLQTTNRDDGPHLHIHTPILNRARCADGEYRSIDAQSLTQGDKWAIAAVGELALDENLEALGIKLETRADGKAREIVGIPQETLDLFSTRATAIGEKVRPAIEAAEARHNRPLTKRETYDLKRFWTLKTRPGKSDGKTMDELLDKWQEQHTEAMAQGLGPTAALIRRMVEEGPRRAAEFSPHDVISSAVARVAEGQSTWTRGKLRHEIRLQLNHLGGLQNGQATQILDELTDRALKSDLVVTVRDAEGMPVPTELLGKGETLYSPALVRYSARETLDAEDVLRRASYVRGRPHLDADPVQGWLGQYGAKLSDAQARVVAGILTSDRALAAIVGPPGTGKSTVTGAIAQALEDLTGGEGRVQGLAVSSNAAKVLAEDGLSLTSNIAAWLGAQQRIAEGKASEEDLAFAVRARDIVLIDESSMVDERQVRDVRAYVEAAGGRLLLVGDPQQLASIGAGGVMELIADHAETFTLTDVHRFKAAWERDASTRLRDGEVSALDDYERHGRILAHATKAEALTEAAKAATAERMAGRTFLVITDTNDEATAVSSAVRNSLIGLGVVRTEEGEVELDGHGGSLSPGDDIMCRRNDYRVGVLNRETYRVDSISEDGQVVTVQDTETGDLIDLPVSYVSEHGSLAYASTVHAAQGRTVDSGRLVTDGKLDRAALLVALTRGRFLNVAHVATTGDPDDTPARASKVTDIERSWEFRNSRSVASARVALEAALEKDGGKPAATVEYEADQERLASMATNLGRREWAAKIVSRDRMFAHLERLSADGLIDEAHVAALAADKSTDTLASLLRAAEQNGEDPFEVLRDAVVTGGTLAGSRSPAQVLYTRIERGHEPRTRGSARPIPAECSRGVATWFQVMNEQAEDRQRVLGSRVAADPPPWALSTLGPVPADPVERLEWQERAGVVAGYREATGWTDPDRPIGNAPKVTSTERRAAFWQARDALGQPEATRAEAAMTEGQLRNRVKAWQRQVRHAPAHVAKSLQAVETKAEQARTAAILAGEHPDEVQRAYEEAKAKAEKLEEAHQVRAAFVESTADLKAAHDRAKAELTKGRGIVMGEEPDRVTPGEWLALDTATTYAEDEHRTVTEPDVIEPVDVEVTEHLAETAEERAGDLAQREINPPDRDGAFYEKVTRVPTAAEVETIAAEAGEVAELLADRASLDASLPAESEIPASHVAEDIEVAAAEEVAGSSM